MRLVMAGAAAVGNGKDAVRSQLETASCLVMLWSRAASQSNEVQQEVQRAIQAWSHARLVLVTLDDAERPVGLEDLQSLAIAPLAQAFEWTGLINRVNALMAHAHAELPMAPAEHCPNRAWRARVAHCDCARLGVGLNRIRNVSSLLGRAARARSRTSESRIYPRRCFSRTRHGSRFGDSLGLAELAARSESASHPPLPTIPRNSLTLLRSGLACSFRIAGWIPAPLNI